MWKGQLPAWSGWHEEYLYTAIWNQAIDEIFQDRGSVITPANGQVYDCERQNFKLSDVGSMRKEMKSYLHVWYLVQRPRIVSSINPAGRVVTVAEEAQSRRLMCLSQLIERQVVLWNSRLMKNCCFYGWKCRLVGQGVSFHGPGQGGRGHWHVIWKTAQCCSLTSLSWTALTTEECNPQTVMTVSFFVVAQRWSVCKYRTMYNDIWFQHRNSP